MPCHGIACNSSFDKGLTSAEGQLLDHFKCTANNVPQTSYGESKHALGHCMHIIT